MPAKLSFSMESQTASTCTHSHNSKSFLQLRDTKVTDQGRRIRVVPPFLVAMAIRAGPFLPILPILPPLAKHNSTSLATAADARYAVNVFVAWAPMWMFTVGSTLKLGWGLSSSQVTWLPAVHLYWARANRWHIGYCDVFYLLGEWKRRPNWLMNTAASSVYLKEC